MLVGAHPMVFTHLILFSSLEHKIPIISSSCNILYVYCVSVAMSSDACKRHCHVGVYSGVFWNVFRSTYWYGHFSQLLQTRARLSHNRESRNRWHRHRTSTFLGVFYRIDNEYLLFTLLGSLAKSEQTRDCIP